MWIPLKAAAIESRVIGSQLTQEPSCQAGASRSSEEQV